MLRPLGSFSVAEFGLALTESYYGQWSRVGRVKEKYEENSEASLKDSLYAEYRCWRSKVEVEEQAGKAEGGSQEAP